MKRVEDFEMHFIGVERQTKNGNGLGLCAVVRIYGGR